MLASMRSADHTLIQRGDYTAEVLRSIVPDDATWYVVIQPRYSRDILGIDRYSSLEEARAAAYKALEGMNDLKGKSA